MSDIEKKEPAAKSIGWVFEWIDSFVVSMVVVILLFTFFLGKVEVEGNSMQDTLQNGDQLIISDFNYTPSNGDIVIVSRNITNTEENEIDSLKPLVKRIIAVGGQTIKVEEEKVYVDGVELKEDYIRTPTDNKGFYGEQTVPDGYVFVMGDNRYDSHDSRSSDIGFVDERYILGKVMLRIYPFSEFTAFN